MAKKSLPKELATVPSKHKFAESLFKIGRRFSLHKTFDDFLTMSIAACTPNLETGRSHYEEVYMQTIAHYKDSELRHEFPVAFANLLTEMEEGTGSSVGNDVLGDFFEKNISNGRNGQYFTPFPVCQFMASITNTDSVQEESEEKKPLRILDPTCGSGRVLLAAYKVNGNANANEYYGIDIDRTCVKMTALNLFLNGMWNSEVMCANALAPDDFVFPYYISFIPLGIFKIEDKEKSKLWHMHKTSFTTPEKQSASSPLKVETKPFGNMPIDNSTQLDLF